MSKTLKFLGAAAFALCSTFQAQAEELTIDSVMATVDGAEITLGHMIMVRALLPEQYQQLGDEALWDGILDQLIQQQVLSTDASAKETPRVRIALENERRSQLASVVVTQMSGQAVSDEEVEAAYKEQYLEAEHGTEYNASHILVESQQDAQDIVDQLDNGADFAELARTKSTGPSGPNGGSLGWFSEGMMVQPFQDAVEELETGTHSGPVATQFGWHVIKLNEKRIKEAPAMADVRDALEAQVRQQKIRQKIDDLLAKAQVTRTNTVDVDTSMLSKFELLED